MARTALCAGLLALSAVQCMAIPTMDSSGQPMGEWEAAAMEAQRAAAASIDATMKDSEHMEGTTGTGTMPRMVLTDMQEPTLVQEAVLEAIMKEIQNIFKNSMTVPGWENMDSAAEIVKQIVERIRERLSNIAPSDNPESNRTQQTTATALRGVTNDFLKEIMVQEAVIETLWAVLRDTQARPWITNEQQAMHIAATTAVQGFLGRMQERLRTAGFSEEDIYKLLPRTRGGMGCGGPFDSCPERNMGKKGRGYGYGYGWGYPTWGWSYPVYDIGCGGCGTCGYSTGYGCGSRAYWRRLAEVETPETGFPVGMPVPPMPVPPMQPTFPFGPGPISRELVEGTAGVETPMGPMGSMGPIGPMGPMDRMGTMEEPRSMHSYHHGGWGYGYPGWGYYRRPGYSYGYPGWSYGYYRPGYGYGYPGWSYGWRRLEVPDITVPLSAAPSNEQPTGKPTTNRMGMNPMQQTTFRRAGELRTPFTTYNTQSAPVTMETGNTYYPEQPIIEPVQGAWEATFN